ARLTAPLPPALMNALSARGPERQFVTPAAAQPRSRCLGRTDMASEPRIWRHCPRADVARIDIRQCSGVSSALSSRHRWNIFTFIGSNNSLAGSRGRRVSPVVRSIPLIGLIAPMGLWLMPWMVMGRDLGGRGEGYY